MKLEKCKNSNFESFGRKKRYDFFDSVIKKYDAKDITVLKDIAKEQSDKEEKEYQKELKELEKLEKEDSKIRNNN